MTARTYVYTSWKSVYSLLEGWWRDEGPLRKHDVSMAPPSAMDVNMWQRHLLRLIGYIRKLMLTGLADDARSVVMPFQK